MKTNTKINMKISKTIYRHFKRDWPKCSVAVYWGCCLVVGVASVAYVAIVVKGPIDPPTFYRHSRCCSYCHCWSSRVVIIVAPAVGVVCLVLLNDDDELTMVRIPIMMMTTPMTMMTRRRRMGGYCIHSCCCFCCCKYGIHITWSINRSRRPAALIGVSSACFLCPAERPSFLPSARRPVTDHDGITTAQEMPGATRHVCG